VCGEKPITFRAECSEVEKFLNVFVLLDSLRSLEEYFFTRY